jgi:hypothetical protein
MRRYPINPQYDKGLPINAHPGAFGNARKFNFHEGIDLYGQEGQTVYAINPGVIVSNEMFTGPEVGHDWWLSTDAVTVRSETEYFVYGELKSDLRVGDEVRSGSIIGNLVPVLPPEKIRSYIPRHSNVMLHLEKWNFKYNPDTGWKPWLTREDRPEWLEDPTPDLIEILIKNHQKVRFLTL